MTDSQSSEKHQPVTLPEIAAIRQNLNILTSQVERQRIDVRYLTRQVEKLNALFERIETDYQQNQSGQQSDALYNVSRILGTSLDLNEVLTQVMDAVIQLTNAERGFIMLRDDEGTLVIKTARNIAYENLTENDQRYSETIANRVLDREESVLTTNALEDSEFQSRDSIMQEGLRSVMAVPLLARGQAIGVAYVDSRIESDLFDHKDLATFETFAGQAAIAIDNARLFEQTDQQLEQNLTQLQQLRRIDQQLNQTLDTQQAMDITLSWTARLTGAQAGHIVLSQQGDIGGINLYSATHYGFDTDNKEPSQILEAHPQVSDVIVQGQPFHDIYMEKAMLMLPIMRDGVAFGALILCRNEPTLFEDAAIDMAQRVIDRAAVAIENARLYGAVQAANTAKSEFVGTLAHELKAPMNAIMGYATLTQMIGEKRGHFVEREREYLDKVVNTVQRMERLVSDLADVSRIESGHFSYTPDDHTVEAIIEDLRSEVVIHMQKRNHTYIENIAPDLPKLYVDAYRLLQVLINLVSNAYKYTPDGGTITLTVDRVGDRVRFCVQDTGIGLSEEELEQLGNKFWRASSRHVREQAGTGLGFSITRHLVELMGSHITIKSTEGVGSCFSFDIASYQAR